MRKTIIMLIVSILALVVLILLAPSAMAGEIHGKVFSKIELYNDYSGQQWGVDLHYDFNRWFSVGAELITLTNGVSDISFIPTNQYYDIYFQYKPSQNITLKLGQWCIHPVLSDAYITGFSSTSTGLAISAEYKY